MILQGALPTPVPGLQKCACFRRAPDGYTILRMSRKSGPHGSVRQPALFVTCPSGEKDDFNHRCERKCRQSSVGGGSAKRAEASRDVSFERGGNESSGGNGYRSRGLFRQGKHGGGPAWRGDRVPGLFADSRLGEVGRQRD